VHQLEPVGVEDMVADAVAHPQSVAPVGPRRSDR
jgi:hypothetical protein